MILFVFLCFFPPLYEMADDYSYSNYIANGYANIIFSNYFLFKLISLIQSIIFPINAYTIFNVFLSLLCFTSFSIVFFDKYNYIMSICISVILNGFFAINHYSTVSFTRLPALLSVAGFLLVYNFFYKSKSLTIFGSILVLLGSMYRFRIFLVALAMFLIFVFAYELSNCLIYNDNNREIRSDFLKHIFEPKRLIAGTLIILFCFSAYFLSDHFNTATDELKYYKQYTTARSQVWDYKPADYFNNKDEYSKINIDENDLKMLELGYLDDEGAFSLNNLKSIRKITDDSNSKSISLKDVFIIIKDNLYLEIFNIRGLGDRGIVYFFFLCIFLVYLLLLKNKRMIVPFFLLLFIIPIYVYLWLTGKAPFRAIYVMWLFAVTFMFYSFDFECMRDKSVSFARKVFKNRKSKMLSLVLCVLFAAGCSYITNIGNITYNPYEHNSSVDKCVEYISNHSDVKFEFSRDAGIDIHSVENDLDIYHVARSKNGNSIGFSCTYYRLPFNNIQMEQFGTENLYSNLLNDNVVFITCNTDTINCFEKYLEKYYSKGKDVSYRIVKKIDSFMFIDFYC